jgi:hypothetical protein
MNGNIFRPEVTDIDGITQCYQNVIKNIRFSGPTYFAPMIRMWNEMVNIYNSYQFRYDLNAPRID